MSIKRNNPEKFLDDATGEKEYTMLWQQK